jgi:hypothetical protein
MGILKDIHPSIFEARDRITAAMMVGKVDENAAQAIGEHQSEWVKTYGTGCAALCSVLAVAVFGATFTVKAMEAPKGIVLLTFFAMALLAAMVIYKAYERNKRQLTAHELAKLLPALKLTEAQRAYAETILALERAPSMPAEERKEIQRHLNDLLDEDARLASHLEWLGTDSSENLSAERHQLQARHDAATDPVAKAAFLQSIEMVESRIKASKAQIAAKERAEAQRSMVQQAVLSVRDSVSRMSGHSPEAPSLNLDKLRQTVATVHTQAAAVESAVEEVRAITG